MATAKQLSLFEARRPTRQAKQEQPPHNGTATSREAAERIAAVAPTQEVTVLAYVADCGARGATRSEISDALGLKLQSVCARVNKLLCQGALDDGGTRMHEGRRQQVVVEKSHVTEGQG